MNIAVMDFLNHVAEKVPSSLPEDDGLIWVTKARGDYITRVGMENESVLGYLVEVGATEHLSSHWEAGKPVNLAFSPSQQKWYGWSHRAIYGFGIGSECKKGDCHYRPTDKEDFLVDTLNFWSDPEKENLRVYNSTSGKGVHVEWEYSQNIPNKSLRGKTTGCFVYYPEKYGRGEWVAKTLADARQMAIDFAEGVS